MGEDRQPPQKKRSTALLALWFCSFALGFPLALDCLSHIATDNHRRDAVVPLNLAQSTDWAESKLRTLRGGRFRVWFSTVGFDRSDEGHLFVGRVEASVRDSSGGERFAGAIGKDGVPIAKTVNSGWADLGDVDLPAVWLKPWLLRARVTTPDPEFSALEARIILRKFRADTGMGGLMFYVFVFPAVGLVLLSIFLSIVLFTRGLHWPAALTFIGCVPLLFLI